jgi:SAM-dependent methyltransferase
MRPDEESSPSLNERVRKYWEQGPVGTSPEVTTWLEPLSSAWFAKVEDNRYAKEPFIHAVAQFTRHGGKRVLEIGVGAGTDHLQWARAGCRCYGIDLTDVAIATTRAHLALHGFESDLRRADAEALPFPDGDFDLVWSWGVIHHSAAPEKVVAEIHRVLRPGGEFRGMMYKRRSIAVATEWIKHAALRGRPWRTFADVLWHHFESVGTKAYTEKELARLFAGFANARFEFLVTPYDTQNIPRFIRGLLPPALGSFIAIHATR